MSILIQNDVVILGSIYIYRYSISRNRICIEKINVERYNRGFYSDCITKFINERFIFYSEINTIYDGLSYIMPSLDFDVDNYKEKIIEYESNFILDLKKRIEYKKDNSDNLKDYLFVRKKRLEYICEKIKDSQIKYC